MTLNKFQIFANFRNYVIQLCQRNLDSYLFHSIKFNENNFTKIGGSHLDNNIDIKITDCLE